MAWGIYALIRGEHALMEPAVQALDELDGWMRIFALFALGGLGGGAGGLLGWIVHGFGGGLSGSRRNRSKPSYGSTKPTTISLPQTRFTAARLN